MKRKIGMVAVLTVIIIIAVLFLGTGKVSSAMLEDYFVAGDGGAIEMKVGVASSMGYIRTFKVREDGNKKYITFYYTYGLNSRIGAMDKCLIRLSPAYDQIYFYSGDKEYRLVLQKDSKTGKWERP